MSAMAIAEMRVQPRRASVPERQEPVGGSGGFALILAILALLLLTFLGLTLATTTSTELQIASNYRWSQQAAYNAEAGIEVAKVALRNTVNWGSVLPVARGGGWTMLAPAAQPLAPLGMPLTDVNGTPLRHWQNWSCDDRGADTGYGLVLNDPVQGPLQYITTPFAGGPSLNGAFTVWVRRDTTLFPATGQIQDNGANTTLVLTSEGIAPFQTGVTAAGAAETFAQAHMAVAVLQLVVGRNGGQCNSDSSQVGAGISGSNFDPCSRTGNQNTARGGGGAFSDDAREAGCPASAGFGSGGAGSGVLL